MTIPLTIILAKARVNTQEKGKGKHVDVVETEQPQLSETASTVSYPSQDPSVYCRTLVHFKRGPVDHGCGNQFRVIHKGDKLVPSICFSTVAHNFTPVQSRFQDKRYRCLILESTQQVEHDSNMTEDDW